MEKLKSLVGITGSLIFIILQVLLFSCEEKKSVNVIEEKKGDTVKSMTRNTDSNFSMDSGFFKNLKMESHDLEIKLKALGEKAKKKGGEIGNSIKEQTNKMESQRKGFQKDSTSEGQMKMKADWEKFKVKTHAAIDSLEKKLNN